MRRLAALFALSVAFDLGCSSDEQINPTIAPSSTDTTTSSSTGTGGAPPTPKRQVLARNPIGGPLGNLLADGDFELSIVPEYAAGGQYGWIAFTKSGGTSALLGETGGLCKSGLRCARIDADAILYGRGTAAPGEAPHRASIWLKPLEDFTPKPNQGSCSFVTTYVIECDSFDIVKKLDAPDAPDADGWCEQTAELPGSKMALCVYAETSIATLADAATLLAAPDLAVTRSAFHTPDDLAARLAATRAWVRSRIGERPRDPRQASHEDAP